MTGIDGPREGFYEGLLLSGSSIGSLMGCLLAILVVRKPRSSRAIIRIIDIFLLVAICLISFPDFWMIYFGRVLFGMVGGVSGCVVPIYVKEITPSEVYGVLSGIERILYTITLYL